MNVTINCPVCGKPLEIPEQFVGQQADCPYCNNRITISPVQPECAKKIVPKAVLRSAPIQQANLTSAPPLPIKNPAGTQGGSGKVMKILLLIIIIIIALFLTVAGFLGWYWYQERYVPEQNKREWLEIVALVDASDSLDGKLAILKKYTQENPEKNKKKAASLIQELEAKKQQEEKRLAELKKQQEIQRQKAIAKQKALQMYKQALNGQRGEHIFIIHNSDKLPSRRVCLFKYDETFMEKLLEVQRLKQGKISLNQTMKELIKLYNEQNDSAEVSAYTLKNVKNAAEEADKKLPGLVSELAVLGEKLIVDGDENFQTDNRAYLNIPVGEWIVVAFSEIGEILSCYVSKKEGLPLFVELSKNGLRDVSKSNYNAQELTLIKKRQEMFVKNNPDKIEQGISGLVFFAQLQDDLNAIGGKLQAVDKGKIKFETVDNIKAIQFAGHPAQGVLFQWEAISHAAPRTMSFWFYCAGYNKYDGGNAIVSYGGKRFGEYWCIETNRSRVLGWPWDTTSEPLVRNINNNKWNHVVVTYDGKKRVCYFNGEVSSIYKTVLKTTVSSLMIGTRINDSNHCFVGSIRNVAIYDRALNQDEIELLGMVDLKLKK